MPWLAVRSNLFVAMTLFYLLGVLLVQPRCPRYKLLLKMGWKSGCGIGKVGNEGMVAPIATTIHANDSSLGLGKALQYSAVTIWWQRFTAGGKKELSFFYEGAMQAN